MIDNLPKETLIFQVRRPSGRTSLDYVPRVKAHRDHQTLKSSISFLHMGFIFRSILRITGWLPVATNVAEGMWFPSKSDLCSTKPQSHNSQRGEPSIGRHGPVIPNPADSMFPIHNKYSCPDESERKQNSHIELR